MRLRKKFRAQKLHKCLRKHDDYLSNAKQQVFVSNNHVPTKFRVNLNSVLAKRIRIIQKKDH
jgi:hypothetical protein